MQKMLFFIKKYHHFISIKYKKSFTLIEIAITLSVLSIISTVSMIYGKQLINDSKHKQNLAKMQIIQNALQSYFIVNGRLPIPANHQLNSNNELYGKEYTITDDIIYQNSHSSSVSIYTENDDLSFYDNEGIENSFQPILNIDYKVYYGIVPFKDLKLNENDVIDIYGNYIEYWVDGQMIQKKHKSITPLALSTFEKDIIKEGYIQKNINHYNQQYACGLDNNKQYLCNKATEDIVFAVNYSQKIENSDMNKDGEQYHFTDIYQDSLKFSFPLQAFVIKDVKTDTKKQNHSIPYVLISHGKNGAKTCSIKKDINSNNLVYKNELTSGNVTNDTIYEAQNCLYITSNNTYGIVGRSDFLKNINKEITFYSGKNTSIFDDDVVYTTLFKLLKTI